MNQNPTTAAPDEFEPVDLGSLAEDLLARARDTGSGRAAHNLLLGQRHVLSQTMIALLAGHELAEHDSPGEATLHVLAGRVTFRNGARERDLSFGDLLPIPPERHAVAAVEDAVLLLTVVKGSSSPGPRVGVTAHQ